MKIQAVVTTGIYCRAGCTAKPLAENVRQLPNAIAALAQGYRPCLRCRPDRLPDLGLAAASPTVAFALRLVADGFLDEHDTEALAARVGYSVRQLVRLFEQEVGASPDFIARAQRAHLARRLLDESDLPITSIAFASGFASLRQMNRVMLDLFHLPPSELRRRRRRGDLLDALDGGLRLRVPYRGQLAARRMIEALTKRAIPGVEEVVDGVYRRTIKTCGHPGVAEVRDAGDGRHLEVTLHLATFASVLEQVRRCRSLFGLTRADDDAETTLARDAQLGPLVRANPGLKLHGAWDAFETGVRVLVGQQVSVAGASTVCGRLVARFGEPVAPRLPGSLRALFPTPAALADADEQDFDMPRARARAILAFARAVADGTLDLHRAQSFDDTIANLTALPGIGPWSANLIAARVFDHADAFPVGDLGLRKGAALLLGRANALDPRELERLSAAWRPWRTTAAAYLWLTTAPTIAAGVGG